LRSPPLLFSPAVAFLLRENSAHLLRRLPPKPDVPCSFYERRSLFRTQISGTSFFLRSFHIDPDSDLPLLATRQEIVLVSGLASAFLKSRRLDDGRLGDPAVLNRDDGLFFSQDYVVLRVLLKR